MAERATASSSVERQRKVGESRPGGRAARVRTDVLSATAKLLREVGFDAMSVEDVARRAGVHKTTVYRRWPTKAELVADAVSVDSADVVPIPDTGSLLDDLKVFARDIATNMASPGGARASRSIVAAAATSTEVAAMWHGYFAERLQLSIPIVQRAIERGELPACTDPKLLIEMLIGPLWVRLLLTGEPITTDLADQVAELVAASCGIDRSDSSRGRRKATRER